jgi:hypothetical protein
MLSRQRGEVHRAPGASTKLTHTYGEIPTLAGTEAP